MTKATVALIKCENYERQGLRKALKHQFDLLGGIDKFAAKGNTVLIKPNLIAPKPANWAVQTDGAVIVETARLFIDMGAKCHVTDSPAWGNVKACLEKLGVLDELQYLGVDVTEPQKGKRCKIGKKGTRLTIIKQALDADVIINLPKFKSHQMLQATFAVKNMFGCVYGKQKAFCHFTKGAKPENFCQMLIDIYDFLKPALTIIDGINALDNGGPIHGRARDFGWLIAGTEPISLECICSQLANMKKEDLPVVKTAIATGYGTFAPQDIELLGDNMTALQTQAFLPATQTGLRFSLTHVCKSILKQTAILMNRKMRPPRD